MSQDTFSKVQKILAETLHINDPSVIKPETDILQDLKADSLDIAELLLNVEQEYNVSIPNEVAMNLKTVQDLLNYVNSL
jgi:acyl carrier protein